MNVLDVGNLSTQIETDDGVLEILRDVSFSVGAHEVVGIVGESGAGKSMTGLAVLGLLDAPASRSNGEILFEGRDLAQASEEELRRLRGDRLTMVFQDPMTALNPVLRVGVQLVETIQAHRAVGAAEAEAMAVAMLQKVGVSAPRERLRQYPHQLSGGMRQRVAIAIALMLNPALVIADEPTTALDVTIQAQVLCEFRRLCSETGTALLWITHDLSVLSEIADRILVMYAGRIVESGRAADVLSAPAHPYTAGLIASLPQGRDTPLTPLPGAPPALDKLDGGCAFRVRCARAAPMCDDAPAWSESGGRGVRCWRPLGEAPP